MFSFDPTEFDVHFTLFGFRIRVHPMFWAMAALLTLNSGDQLPPSTKIGMTLIGIACIFLSILVHELGHAFLIRRAGSWPEIVLHGMGGHAAYHQTRYISPRMKIAISFAGPGAGFILFGIVWGIDTLLDAANVETSFLVRFGIGMLMYINLFWGLFNLLPIFPMDGGQIVRTWMQSRWGLKGLLGSLNVSIVLCILIVTASIAASGSFLSMPVILFTMFCYQNIQEHQFRSSGRI